jgi:hypothetical protein
MRVALRIGFVGVALAAVLGGCGAGGPTSVSEGKRAPKTPAPRAPMRIVVAHRVGPQRVERGEPTEELSASPCPNKGVNGTTTLPIGPDVGYCAQVTPWGRIDVLNTTASAIQVEVGDYKMRLRPQQTEPARRASGATDGARSLSRATRPRRPSGARLRGPRPTGPCLGGARAPKRTFRHPKPGGTQVRGTLVAVTGPPKKSNLSPAEFVALSAGSSPKAMW